MNKEIVLITSGQPSANPRLVKEAILLSKKGFNVKVIYCPISCWADDFDKKLFLEYNSINWICAGYHPVKQKGQYMLARGRRKGWYFINKYLGNIFESNIKTIVMFSQELLKETLQHKADLYVAHNLGAIQAAVQAAKKYNAKAGFDAEDFHRGEFENGTAQQKVTSAVEEKYFPTLNYCTAASPLIGRAYNELFPDQNFIVINNVFSLEYLAKLPAIVKKNELNLFWFSQFIGPKRGLETVIESINECSKLNVRLHLLGNISSSYHAALLGLIEDKTKIIFHAPTLPQNIFAIAQQFDVGLATEIPHTLNREYCLTNKIFTYLLAGNALILSDTKAQQKFIEDFPGVGLLYESENSISLSEIITTFYTQPALLQQVKQNALEAATIQLNWEAEGLIFLELIKKVLEQ